MCGKAWYAGPWHISMGSCGPAREKHEGEKEETMPVKLHALIAPCVATALVAAVPASADVVEIGAMKDNTLYEDSGGTLSNGAGIHFFAGTTANNGRIRRGLIAFDILSNIPAQSTINSVELTLRMSRTISGEQTISLHRLLQDWGEGDSDAPGQEGGGAAAMEGDATWLHTYFDTEFWDTPGGDFDPVGSASTLVGFEEWYTWGSTAGMVDDVQSWLDEPSTNFGWAVLGNEDGFGTAKRFDTHENPLPEYRPVLVVDYTLIPAPGALSLLGLAGLGAAARRRRND
jgi:hypothetical protein